MGCNDASTKIPGIMINMPCICERETLRENLLSFERSSWITAIEGEVQMSIPRSFVSV